MIAASRAARPGRRGSPDAGPPVRVVFYIAYPQRMAGANRSLFELVTNLPPRVHPLVVLTGDGPVAQAYRAAGVPCRVVEAPGELGRHGRRMDGLAPGRMLRAAFALAPYTLRLLRVLREHRADLVHANDPRGTLQILPAARLARIPIVAHLRGEFSHSRSLRMVFERAARRIITVSEGARATLTPRGRARAVTVYNGIRPLQPGTTPVPWLDEARARGAAVVCCFASIVPFKGHHHLLEAVARLNARGWAGRVVVVCVGDWVAGYEFYHDWLRRRCAELGVDNLVFTGWQDDPFAFYRYADLCVLPSVSAETLEVDGRVVRVVGNEGFPRTHLEAMQFGVPVVGTRVAGVPEQVADGETGVLVEPGDPAALADAMEALLGDPDRRRAMGRAGRERVARLFSTAAYVGGVVAEYDALLAKGAHTDGVPTEGGSGG
ncbi:MAG TPA: glycosyltransferase family 4 protein [Longimicrobium sp.]